MANVPESVSSLGGQLKVQYSKSMKELVAEDNYCLDNLKFVEKMRQEGNFYQQPVVLTLPTNPTWVTTGAATPPSLNPISPSYVAPAQIQGSGLVHRDQITYDMIAKASNGQNKAFVEAVTYVLGILATATSRYLELDLLYGSTPLFQSTVAAAVTSSTTNVTVTAATWAAAMLPGLEGQILNIFDASNSYAQVGTNYTIVSTTMPSTFGNGGVVLLKSSAGDATSLVAVNGHTLDFFFLSAQAGTTEGTSYAMLGLKGIITAASTYFNINPALYSLWQGNVVSNSNTQFTFGKLQTAVGVVASRDAIDGMTALVSVPTFSNLVTSQSGARFYDSSFDKNKLVNGTKGLEFWTAAGPIKIQPHRFMHQGEAIVLDEDVATRVGPIMDVSTQLPGMPTELILNVPDSPVWETRVYANQAVLLEKPVHSLFINGIVNA
jgi:hypothetical protein